MKIKSDLLKLYKQIIMTFDISTNEGFEMAVKRFGADKVNSIMPLYKIALDTDFEAE